MVFAGGRFVAAVGGGDMACNPTATGNGERTHADDKDSPGRRHYEVTRP